MTITKNYEATDNFYIQKMYLTNIRDSRFTFLANICQGKKILHIGCADTMVFNVNTNLHIYLSRLKNIKSKDEQAIKEKVAKTITERNKQRSKNSNKEELAKAEFEAAEAVRDLNELESIKKTQLHGLDIDIETINKLKEVCSGVYYTSYNDVKEDYDIIIVPEVMEHVPDVNLFLKDIFSIKSKEYLFTVPSMIVSEVFCCDEYSLETVHPDHKYWFSPYTLYNTLKPFSENFNIQMYFLENKTQIGIRLSLKE